jgi:hypothetical protein
MELPKYMVISHPKSTGTTYIISTQAPIVIGYIAINNVLKKYKKSDSMCAFIPADQDTHGIFLLCQLDNTLSLINTEQRVLVLEKMLSEMLNFYLTEIRPPSMN